MPEPTDATRDYPRPTETPTVAVTVRQAEDDAPPVPAVPGYEVLEPLGEGGMGVVWKAREVRLNRVVALKVPAGRGPVGSSERVRFLAEAEAMATIDHPHVVRVYELGEADGRPFIALEYLPGGTLSERVKAAGRIDPVTAAGWVEKAARGVQAAHDRQIVHRDLKPANVLFDADGEPKVTDFGIAKRAASDLTQSWAVMGTPTYMSPEQASGKAKFAGPPTDVWALGVILYECLTGGPPFRGPDVQAVYRGILFDDPPPVRAVVPGAPPDLEVICSTCLAKEPADRYATAAALADDLRRYLDHKPISARATSDLDTWVKWSYRNPPLAAAVYVLILLGSVIATSAALAPNTFLRFLRAAWFDHWLATLLLATAGLTTLPFAAAQAVKSARERVGFGVGALRIGWLIPAAVFGTAVLATGVRVLYEAVGGWAVELHDAVVTLPPGGRAVGVLAFGVLIVLLGGTVARLTQRRPLSGGAYIRPMMAWGGVAYGLIFLAALLARFGCNP